MATPPTGRRVGRPPKSVAQKQAEGNRGKRKLPDSLYAIDDIENEDIPQPPETGLGQSGMKIWMDIWNAAPWLNPLSDYYAVLSACRNYDEYETLRIKISLGILPEFYRTKGGEERMHPAVTQMNNAKRAYELSMSEIGMTPTGRARLENTTVNDVDPLEDMRKRLEEERRELLEMMGNQ